MTHFDRIFQSFLFAIMMYTGKFQTWVIVEKNSEILHTDFKKLSPFEANADNSEGWHVNSQFVFCLLGCEIELAGLVLLSLALLISFCLNVIFCIRRRAFLCRGICKINNSVILFQFLKGSHCWFNPLSAFTTWFSIHW